ncbi:MAG: CfrBI family restriction endonuclease [Selenomonadaceae bacterium]|nr:CfrBI family restriction endonuclease [Selenomonadaceae bacterium]
MFSFENKIIDATVEKLINGEDYRQEVVNDINVKFLDFTLEFFKKIVDAKLNEEKINLDWYKKYFLNEENFDKSDIAIFSGINLKTIHNICGTTTKKIVIDVAKQNYDYLKNLIQQLEVDGERDLNIQIKITKNGVSVDLNLSESLLVLNALATKKIALRGGAWSAIGKRVEKPLLIKLCKICGIPEKNYNAENFVRDRNLDFDREVDFKLYCKKEYRCEVKLMGGGNPESADAVIARNSDIFVADTLSLQNKNQLDSLGICWLELKNHSHEDIISEFKKILEKLEIPFMK